MAPNPKAADAWSATRANKPAPSGAAPRAPQGGLPQGVRSRARGVAATAKRTQQVVMTPPPKLDVDSAIAEILSVPAAEIHRTAAYTWATRAMACYRVCLTKTEFQDSLSFFYLGEHYREAALAHAAMGEGWQPLHAEIEAAMVPDRTLAFTAMRGRSGDATRPGA